MYGQDSLQLFSIESLSLYWNSQCTLQIHVAECVGMLGYLFGGSGYINHSLGYINHSLYLFRISHVLSPPFVLLPGLAPSPSNHRE